MTGIYKITNKLNNKSYIGQSVNIPVRFKDHRSPQKWEREPNSHLYKSFKKYGLDNFTFEVLEECKATELNEKETFYIKKFKTTNKDLGYNKTDGGDSHSIGENNGKALLTEEDVIFIREQRANLQKRRDVFEKVKDKIGWAGFIDVWQGVSWSHIKVEGAYSEEVRLFQESLRGGRGSRSLLSDEEVNEIRSRYVNETVKEIYEDYKNIYSSLESFELVVHGRSYSHLPIYKKRSKKWINK